MKEIVIEMKAKSLEQPEAAFGRLGFDQADPGGVGKIDRQTYGHRIAVPHPKIGKLFEFVGDPMTEVQGAGRAFFEGVSRTGDVSR